MKLQRKPLRRISLEHSFFKNMAYPPFSFIFGLFKQSSKIFTTIFCEKCPSSIRRRDWNSQPPVPVSSHNHWNRPPPLEHSLSKLIPLSFTHSLALLIFECLWLIKIPFGQRREKIIWAVFVAQLVEQLLAIPEICGSDPVIGKPLYRTFVYCQLY